MRAYTHTYMYILLLFDMYLLFLNLKINKNISRPDMIFAADWTLKTKISIYLYIYYLFDINKT